MSKQKKSKILQEKYYRIALLLLIISLLCISSSILITLKNRNNLSFSDFSVSGSEATSKIKNNLPKNIDIPAIKINLSIEESSIINGNWLISTKGASHLENSGRPGEKSNIIIYAHNTNDKFGQLTKIKSNDRIIIINEAGIRFEYQVMSTSVVSPSDVEILKSHNKEELTLYTCTGLFDSKRFVVKALPLF